MPPSTIVTYLFAIAHRRTVDRWRRLGRLPEFINAWRIRTVSPGTTYNEPDAHAISDELRTDLTLAIAALPIPQREAFLLCVEVDSGLKRLPKLPEPIVRPPKADSGSPGPIAHAVGAVGMTIDDEKALANRYCASVQDIQSPNVDRVLKAAAIGRPLGHGFTPSRGIVFDIDSRIHRSRNPLACLPIESSSQCFGDTGLPGDREESPPPTCYSWSSAIFGTWHLEGAT